MVTETQPVTGAAADSSRWVRASRTWWPLTAVLVVFGLVLLAAGSFYRRSLSLEAHAALTSNQALARAVASLIEAREERYRDLLLSYAGRFNFRERIEQRDRPDALRHLRQIHEFFPGIGQPFLADPAGVVWAAYPEVPEAYERSFANRDWYRGVSRSWAPYVSDVFATDVADRALLVVLAVPVRNVAGQVIGILGVGQRLAVIREWLLPLEIPGGDFYVVDRQGQLVFHRTRARTEQVSDYARVPVVQRLLAGETGTAELENPVEGEVRLTAYRVLPSLGWGVVVHKEKNLALENMRTVTLVAAAAGLVLALGLAVLGVIAVGNRQRAVRALVALEERRQQADRARDELRQAKEEVERASRAKSEFLSRMSHELRTPLNAILGFGQVLEMDPLDAEQHDSVRHILSAGRHLLGLIDEVLDIARIEAGRLSLSLEPVHVGTVLDEARSLIRPLAEAQGVELRVAAPPAPDLHVLADRQRLRQVLLNLLSNAVKYTPGTGLITLWCEVTPEHRLRLNVRDTGRGIPPDKLGQLFTPFERLGAEASGVEGTGLGLALSKGLVEAMGGTIDVASTAGQGSLFWIELGRAEAPAADLEAQEDAQAPTPRARPGVAVLYVEDNLPNFQLIERLLARRPHVKLLSAMQGRLGLELAREHRPSVILLDLHLPDIQGREVLQRLREDARTRDIPVVVISADASPGQVQRLLAAGARDYLTKPIDVRRFLAILDATLAADPGAPDG